MYTPDEMKKFLPQPQELTCKKCYKFGHVI